MKTKIKAKTCFVRLVSVLFVFFRTLNVLCWAPSGGKSCNKAINATLSWLQLNSTTNKTTTTTWAWPFQFPCIRSSPEWNTLTSALILISYVYVWVCTCVFFTIFVNFSGCLPLSSSLAMAWDCQNDIAVNWHCSLSVVVSAFGI